MCYFNFILVLRNCSEVTIFKDFHPHLTPHQFAYRDTISTEDSMATALHITLTHLEHKHMLLFTNFYSTQSSLTKLIDFSLPHSIHSRLKRLSEFPTVHSLHPLSTPTHTNKSIVKFADNTTVIGLITGGDEMQR